jgi:hypothetical protein
LNRSFEAIILVLEQLQSLKFFRAEYLDALKTRLEHARTEANGATKPGPKRYSSCRRRAQARNQRADQRSEAGTPKAASTTQESRKQLMINRCSTHCMAMNKKIQHGWMRSTRTARRLVCNLLLQRSYLLR